MSVFDRKLKDLVESRNGRNPYTVKSRDIVYHNEPDGQQRLWTGSQWVDTKWPMSVVGRQRTLTRGNPAWRHRAEFQQRHANDAPGGKRDRYLRRDMGGNFETVRHVYKDNAAFEQQLNLVQPYVGSSVYYYNGPLVARYGLVGPTSNVWPAVSTIALRDQMIAKGATAIKKTIPTNPVASFGTLLAELVREGLPSIPGSVLLGKNGRGPGSTTANAREGISRVGSEYLNYQFAVAPTISELRTFYNAVKNSSEILEQLERDAGRLVRRRYEFPEEIETRVVEDTGRQPYPPINGQFYASTNGRYTLTRTTRTKTWFSGAYSYSFPVADVALAKFRQAEQRLHKLFGLRITPELLWELTPWSWAIDWKSNVGDVLSNVGAFSRDGLVLRWGYVMCHQTITETHTTQANLKSGTRLLTQSFTTEVKKRIKATPYGFGLDPDWKDLSSFQLSILAALGMSRVS